MKIQHPLTARLRSLWIRALLSGRFKQGTGQLCVLPNPGELHPRYCCMGVLHKVATKEGIQLQCRLDFASTLRYYEYPTGRIFELVSEAVQDKLAIMNDAERKTFKQIAAWIKRNVNTNGTLRKQRAKTT